jgi:hypothetical protein
MKIQSIFGPYAGQLQVIIDESLSRFKPTWYQKYFTWDIPQTTLTFNDVIGASRIEAAASIVSRMSSAPLRSRNSLKKATGEIPAIKEKFAMREDDYRDFLALQALITDDAQKQQVLLDLLFKDINALATAPDKRIDMMCLEAVSTGQISLTVANNPDGIVLRDPIDLFMPASNKIQASVLWSVSATAKPLTDIAAVVQAGVDLGRTFDKILMSRTQFLAFAKAKETVDSLISYNQLQKGAPIATLAKVNEYLEANLLPKIELVDVSIGIEKDGIITPVRPWSVNNVSFIPAGNLGKIKNALSIEQIKPVAQVNYATYNRALVSKWGDNDPWGEFTAIELNAMPSLADSIDGIFLLAIAGF